MRYVVLALCFLLSASAFAQLADVPVGRQRTVRVQPGKGSAQVCVYYRDAVDPVADSLECAAVDDPEAPQPVVFDVTEFMAEGEETRFGAVGLSADPVESKVSPNSAGGTLPVPPTMLPPAP